jgi:hypothetical protein
MSTLALIVLFGTGFVATSGRHVSHQYLTLWLPLIPGAIAYLRLRLRSATVGSREPSTPPAG